VNKADASFIPGTVALVMIALQISLLTPVKQNMAQIASFVIN
jgi:hypothetical protein